MDDQIRTILIIITSVSIFGLINWVFGFNQESKKMTLQSHINLMDIGT